MRIHLKDSAIKYVLIKLRLLQVALPHYMLCPLHAYLAFEHANGRTSSDRNFVFIAQKDNSFNLNI
jgi:hypothetical protein